jgi:hypothetical protein
MARPTGPTRSVLAQRRKRGRSPRDLSRDPSIDGFCFRKGISRSTYNNLRRRGLGPLEIQAVARGKVTITPANEEAWDQRHIKAAGEAAE